MTDKQIIVNDLSCDNCPEAQRCQEQRAKKEYAINQVLQDIPSEYANVITRLRQIIPSITRCDYVLEKQLKRKEQECEELKEQFKLAEPLYQSCNIKDRKIKKYEQTLAEIKEIAEGMYDLWINKTKYTDIDNLVKHLLECELSRIIYKLDEISECGVNND